MPRVSVSDGRRLLTVVAVVAIGIGIVWFAVSGSEDDADLTVPAPEPADRQAVVAQLAEATAAQGVCYGWRLDDGGSPRSVGSNLGDTVPVSNACRRWVQLEVSIVYTPVASEDPDTASVTVATSPDLLWTGPTTDDLGRLGLTEDRFLDDPADSTMRAVLALPLLLAERGEVVPVPRRSATATPATPLEAAGSDFWRDRLGRVVTAGVILVAAVLIGVYGWLTLRAERAR